MLGCDLLIHALFQLRIKKKDNNVKYLCFIHYIIQQITGYLTMYIIGLRPQKRISFCLCIYIHIYAHTEERGSKVGERKGRKTETETISQGIRGYQLESRRNK